MIAELVNTYTSDGLRLDGALHRAKEPDSTITVDAAVCLHGVGSNFYGSSLFRRLAEDLVPLGIDVLRVNTRGHDSVSVASTRSVPVRQGAAYEIVDNCRYDVAGWLDFLAQQGKHRVALIGHSLGAIKAVYAQAHAGLAATACVIAISPPRLSYQAFRHGPDSAKFFAAIRDAEQRVREGAPESLIQVQFPFPMLITAAGYLDKYGPAERYNFVECLQRLDCPTRFIYGERELEHGGIAFAGLPEVIRSRCRAQQSIEIGVVPDADHFYSGKADQLAAEVTGWIKRSFPAD